MSAGDLFGRYDLDSITAGGIIEPQTVHKTVEQSAATNPAAPAAVSVGA